MNDLEKSAMDNADRLFYTWFETYLKEWEDSPGQQDEIRRMRDQLHDAWRAAWPYGYRNGVRACYDYGEEYEPSLR